MRPSFGLRFGGLPAVLIILLSSLVGCGGGGASSPPPPPPTPTLKSIAVTPANSSIAVAATVQFTATGTFSDASTQNITSSATWSSSATSVATINTAGLATGASAGSTTITAISGEVSGSTSLAVTPPPPQVTIATSTASISLGQTVTVTWSSNNATSCTASDSWTGTLAASGSQEVTPTTPGPLTYSITCSGTGGNSSASADLTVNQVPGGPQAPGGSNYAWYQLDPPCTREPYGVIYNFNTANSTINQQLKTMFNNGQRRLRIPIFHGRGPFAPGTIIDSTGGTFAQLYLNNFTSLLAAVKTAGFQEVEISFHPQGNNDPTSWTSFSTDYLNENWSLIQTLHPIIASSGLKYHIDLSNEGIPTATQPALLQYSQNLWALYVQQFGTADTVGFSIIPDSSRLSQVSAVYGQNGVPSTFDLHFYDNAGTSFASAVATLNAAGFQGTGWILGEAYYNDPAEASQLRQQIDATAQPVYYLTQWPLTSQRLCSDVDITPPLDFSNYTATKF